METQKNKSIMRHVVAYIVMTLIIGVLGYRIYTLENEKFEISKKEILTEHKLLSTVRICELNKSLSTLKLWECKGIKHHIIDSIKVHLHFTNKAIIKRDSAYIADRYENLK